MSKTAQSHVFTRSSLAPSLFPLNSLQTSFTGVGISTEGLTRNPFLSNKWIENYPVLNISPFWSIYLLGRVSASNHNTSPLLMYFLSLLRRLKHDCNLSSVSRQELHSSAGIQKNPNCSTHRTAECFCSSVAQWDRKATPRLRLMSRDHLHKLQGESTIT